MDDKTSMDDAKLARLLIRRRLITDGQLKAAMDYQRSLGGKLLEVLVKLDLVRPSQLDEFLSKISSEDEGSESSEPFEPGKVDPSTVNVPELKVHRRLLEKLPQDLVEKHLLIVFFPVPHGDSRKIVLGHGKAITPEVREKIRSIIGIDLSTLELDPGVAQGLLADHGRIEAPKKPPPPTRPPAFKADDIDITFLVNLLVRKGILTVEELEAMVKSKQFASRCE